MLVKVHAVLSNLCKSYGKNSSNRRFLTIVAPMISYVFIEMDSAILCKKYGMLCVFAFHIHHCHLDLLDLLSLWAEATSWYLWLTYRIRCPVELNFVFLQIHQDSGFIGFWIGQWILCWLSVFFNPCGSYGTSQARWCLATGALSGNLWPKTGWFVPSIDSAIAAFYKTHRCYTLLSWFESCVRVLSWTWPG